ncbi:MAG TPA: pyrroline-5-carboxylate reductase [Caulobacteraceae bacterium]|nr:pyrroline-5-carboxylate reductase [Caulobacteraceae bacterium]
MTADFQASGPLLMLGAGRMGGALIEGWAKAGVLDPARLIVVEPHPSDALRALGAPINPPNETLRQARTVLLAVKPQMWRAAAQTLAPNLADEAVIVSIAAGVSRADISAGFGGRRTARVMPTTAVAIGKGVASIFAPDEDAHARAHALFDPVAATVDLADEALMHAATAVSGSAPAYLYAFIEALEDAGVMAGLSGPAARRLVRNTIVGASALLESGGEEPSELRRQVTSPGGTTQAALEVLMGQGGLGPLLEGAVAAAVARSKELAG